MTKVKVRLKAHRHINTRVNDRIPMPPAPRQAMIVNGRRFDKSDPRSPPIRYQLCGVETPCLNHPPNW